MKDLPRLTDEDFDVQRLVDHSGQSVIIFSADWCPYCVSFFNNWREYNRVSSVMIADLTSIDSRLWESFDLNVVPSMAIFKDGILQKRWDGILGRGLSIDQIEDVNSYLSKP